jgi:hypothetical protein
LRILKKSEGDKIMSNETFTDLLGSVVLSEEVRENINAAWDSKQIETREEVTAELREEFASRYEHDKGQLVEAMDKLIQDTISGASDEFKKLHEDTQTTRVKYATKISDDAQLLQKFVMETLAKEVAELKADRASQKVSFKGLEEFALRKLTNELSELHEDHKRLVEARVKLISEGRTAIEEARTQFIKKASEKVNGLVVESFKTELSSLKTDIREAKENNFGRKIMEAFAAEFMASKFADGTAVSELTNKITEMEVKLAEAHGAIAEKENLITESSRRQRLAEDQMTRSRIMQELNSPLSKDKRVIMDELLESTPTSKLNEAFQKYLPSVLNEEVRRDKKVIVEGQQSQKTVITGNKSAQVVEEVATEVNSTIADLRKLAGI